MKLYATITSERASKGQGGNNEIDFELLAGGKENPVRVAEGNLTKKDGGYELYITTLLMDGYEQSIERYFSDSDILKLQKGKRQKGESIYDNIKEP